MEHNVTGAGGSCKPGGVFQAQEELSSEKAAVKPLELRDAAWSTASTSCEGQPLLTSADGADEVSNKDASSDAIYLLMKKSTIIA